MSALEIVLLGFVVVCAIIAIGIAKYVANYSEDILDSEHKPIKFFSEK